MASCLPMAFQYLLVLVECIPLCAGAHTVWFAASRWYNAQDCRLLWRALAGIYCFSSYYSCCRWYSFCSLQIGGVVVLVCSLDVHVCVHVCVCIAPNIADISRLLLLYASQTSRKQC
jgi:hypothetical protein